MADDDDLIDPPADDPPADPPADDDPPADPPDDGDPSKLGDAGKRALDAMRARWKTERDARKKADVDLAAALAAKAGDDDAAKAEQIRREAETAATSKANQRIIRAEIRAAAAGKLADPKDALTFLDLDQLEVDDNGEIDSDEVAEAIEELLKKKPYLAAATAKRFQGTADSGAQSRNAGKPKQVTETELKTMTAEQIVKAQDEGRLANLLGAS